MLARDDYRLRIIDPQGMTRATYACAASCELVLQESSRAAVAIKASPKFDRRD